MDSSGEPLSIGQILNNLEQLEKSSILAGAEVDSVSAVNPSQYIDYSCILCVQIFSALFKCMVGSLLHAVTISIS